MDFSSLLFTFFFIALSEKLSMSFRNFTLKMYKLFSFSFNDSLSDRLKQGGVFSCMKLTICHGSWHTFLQFYRLLLLIGKLPVKVKAQRERGRSSTQLILEQSHRELYMCTVRAARALNRDEKSTIEMAGSFLNRKNSSFFLCLCIVSSKHDRIP